jgi:hypothetical protein
MIKSWYQIPVSFTMNVERHINQQNSRQRQIPNATKAGPVEILHGQTA